MKKISFIFTMMALLLGLGTGVKAQTWDFTQSNADDVAALKAATSEWTYTEASDRYENKVAINGVVKAGSRVLALTEGLQVNAAENKLRIDNAKRLQLAGKNVTVTIPSLTKGQTVTIVFASTGDNAVTFDALTNLSGASGFTAANKNTTQTGTATVTNDGAVSFASTGGSINITLCDSRGNNIQQTANTYVNANSKYASSQYVTYGVKRGTYYIRVNKAKYYSIAMVYNYMKDIAGKTKSAARALPYGKNYTGVMANGDDVDVVVVAVYSEHAALVVCLVASGVDYCKLIH